MNAESAGYFFITLNIGRYGMELGQRLLNLHRSASGSPGPKRNAFTWGNRWKQLPAVAAGPVASSVHAEFMENVAGLE